ncbi:MAG: hypothetical protein R3F34_00900 [Planctomycetota bacterium]
MTVATPTPSRLEDRAGNRTEQRFVVVLDTTLPTLSFSVAADEEPVTFDSSSESTDDVARAVPRHAGT